MNYIFLISEYACTSFSKLKMPSLTPWLPGYHKTEPFNQCIKKMCSYLRTSLVCHRKIHAHTVFKILSARDEKWHESSLQGIFKAKGSTTYSVIPSWQTTRLMLRICEKHCTVTSNINNNIWYLSVIDSIILANSTLANGYSRQNKNYFTTVSNSTC